MCVKHFWRPDRKRLIKRYSGTTPKFTHASQKKSVHGGYVNLRALVKVLITKDLEKHFNFRIKGSDIKKWRFGDDMSSLSNVNYCKFSNDLHLTKVTWRVEAQWRHGWCAHSRIARSGFEPWPGTLCCILGRDTELSRGLSLPRSINGYWRIVG